MSVKKVIFKIFDTYNVDQCCISANIIYIPAFDFNAISLQFVLFKNKRTSSIFNIKQTYFAIDIGKLGNGLPYTNEEEKRFEVYKRHYKTRVKTLTILFGKVEFSYKVRIWPRIPWC